MKVKSESEVAQSCLTLSDPMDCSLPGFSVHGILQAKVLEWGAIAFSDTHTHPMAIQILKLILFKVKVKITQLCLILCDPMDYTVHGIL